MADQVDIDAVKVQLPDEASEFGLDDDTIGALLDGGLSQTKTILASWRAIAAKTATYTDVNESGSSRNLTVLNANARQMIPIWQAQADREDESADTLLKPRFNSHTVTRV